MARKPYAAGKQVQVPPPVGGLNARDSLANMPPQDALTLDNLTPQTTFVKLRRGYSSFATGMPAAVESLMEWAGPASRKFFAASGTAIYDITSGGAVGAGVQTGLTNARWQSTMFSTAGGNFLVLCNGADTVRNYDGAAWTAPAITGVTSANLIQVASWKRRLWFVEKSTTKAWYLPTDSIAGAANSLDLGAVFRLGGKLTRIISASFDSFGQGLSDFIAFLSTNGELAVYNGTDPSTVGTFALVGVFRLGTPIGDRCTYQSGGDAVMITNDGALSLMQMLRVDRTEAPRAAITDKIAPLFVQAWQDYGTNYGWQIIGYPSAHLVIVNVPTATTTAIQYVMNAITGAWCRWTNMNAACWALFNDLPYFGAQSGGVVYRADTGTADNTAAISWNMKQAFNGCGNAARLKFFKMLRPILTVNAPVVPNIGIDVDYADTTLSGTSTVTVSGALWDAAIWDASVWGGTSLTALPWASIGKIGRVVSPKMAGSAMGVEMQLNAFDLMFEPAQVPTL